MATIETLLNNHLAFVASHRATVTREGNRIRVVGGQPEFTYDLLGAGTSEIDVSPSTARIQLLPTSHLGDEDLHRHGFHKIFGLSYMTLETAPNWRGNGSVRVIEVGRRPDAMDIFSEVQARGFTENDDEFRKWHPYLRNANHRNLRNPLQHFWLGYQEAEAAGTVLTVTNNDVLGIYAVATLPHHRRKGIATAVMAHGIRASQEQRISVVTLQVMQDSPVEEFYRRLGFKRVFTSGVYRRDL